MFVSRCPIVLGAFLVLACGCNKPTESPTKPAAPSQASVSKPDVSMSAAAWRAEFKRDSNAAWQKYKGKVIELSGIVDGVTDDVSGIEGPVFLDAGDVVGVICVVPDRPWTKYAIGSPIKIKGKVLDDSANELLTSCEVTEYTGPKPTVFDSVELAKAFAADRAGTRQKYLNKRMNVEGEVTDIDEKADLGAKFYILTLKGSDGVTVKCGVSPRSETRKLLEGASAGKKAKVFGSFQAPDDPMANEIKLIAVALTELK